MEDIKNFVRWSKGTLPNGAVINQLPTVSLCEFLEAINGGDRVRFYEDEEHKRFNPAIFNTNDTLFVDVDHIEEHFDVIWANLELIMQDCPFIAMIKQSRTKSLHCICVGHWDTPEEHAFRDMYYLGYIARSILKRTGVDLRNIRKALDKHTKSEAQRLFVYNPKYHPYVLNPFPTTVTLDDADKVFEAYPMLRPDEGSSDKTYDGTLYTGGFNARTRAGGERITLNRDYNICGFTGNDARWRVANAVYYLVGGDKDAAKAIIRNNFKNYNDFSFSSVAKGPHAGVLEWVKANLMATYEIPENEYLSYYTDLIVKEFEAHKRILVQAPTGAGKTTLMISLAKKYNAVILVPFNSMLKLYEQESHGDIVIVGSGYTTEYTKDKPVCMIWDRAIGFDLTDRVVISDETHQWFFDRDYRDSAVKTIKKAKEWKNLICISATPAGEAEELGLYVMKFTKKRNTIPTRIINVGNSGGYIRDLIENREFGINYVVFSDRNAMRLYQNFPEGCLLHSQKKYTKEFVDVLDNQRLNNRLTFCTAIAYNGLNFRNTGDYKVIVDIEVGSDTANKIIQAVGRLRSANILEVIVVLSGGGEKQSVAEKVIDNKIFKNINEKNSGVSIVDYDSRYTEDDSIEAMTVIERYLLSHNSKPSIIRDLSGEGYFTIQEERDGEKHSKLRAKQKEASNIKFKEMLRDHKGHIREIRYDDLDEYAKEWKRVMMKLESEVDIDWIKMLDGKNDTCLMDTILKDIWRIYEVCRLPEELFNECYSDARLNEALNWKDEEGNTLSKPAKKKILKRFGEAKKNRSKYEVIRNEYEATSNTEDPLETVIDDLLDLNIAGRRNLKQLRKKNGKDGGRKGKEIVVQDAGGKVLKFGTIKEAAEKFGVSNNTMRTYIKKGKFEIVIKIKKCVYQVINQ